jgi:hypothetical protein
MFVRVVRLGIQVAFAIMLLTVPASAVTVTPGSTTALEPNQNYSYTAILPGGTVINDTFNFTVVGGQLEATTTSIALNAGGDGAFGVRDLTVQWYNSITNALLGTLIVTNGAGVVVDPLASLVLTLVAGTYKVIVTGQALVAGGIYNINVATTPLPPALVLFGTALLGMTLLGRRRRS